MRIIKFRGKTCKDGKWVYGSYLESKRSWGNRKPTKCWIVEEAFTSGGFIGLTQRYPVQEKTVGQFTGLADKNGVEIYEGDLVKGCWNTTFLVVYDRISTSFRANVDNGVFRDIDYYGLDKLEVIGNIHDNLELLKGE